jgi:hypothetical protein
MVFILFLGFGAAFGFVSVLDFLAGTIHLELAEESKNGIKTVFDHFRNRHARY